jgi:hypothetical protein
MDRKPQSFRILSLTPIYRPRPPELRAPASSDYGAPCSPILILQAGTRAGTRCAYIRRYTGETLSHTPRHTFRVVSITKGITRRQSTFLLRNISSSTRNPFRPCSNLSLVPHLFWSFQAAGFRMPCICRSYANALQVQPHQIF